MPPAKSNQGGRTPSVYGVYGGHPFTGALHETHGPAARWRLGPGHPWRCEVCHPPALPSFARERREPWGACSG